MTTQASQETLPELGSLPRPVARYLELALGGRFRALQRVRLRQAGGFRLRPSSRRWAALEAVQEVIPGPRPSFVWQARIRPLPLVTLEVRDAYQQGQGSMRVRLGGLLTLVNQAGSPELAQGCLERYLAEAVWFPSALLPGQGVSWEGAGEDRAWACLEYAGARARLEFRFNRDGEVAEVYSPARPRAVKGGFVPTPWQGRFFGYRRAGGLWVPAGGEVAWLLPQGEFTYWRAEVTDLEYTFQTGDSRGDLLHD